jgi:hypothetical protein
MSLSASYKGEFVEILGIMANGMDVYVTYVDGSSNVKIAKSYIDTHTLSTTLATSAVVA